MQLTNRKGPEVLARTADLSKVVDPDTHSGNVHPAEFVVCD